MRKLATLLLSFAFLGTAAGCDDDPEATDGDADADADSDADADADSDADADADSDADADGDGDSNMDADQSMTESLSLELANVPPLGPDFVYEGWLITDDGPVTTGRFTVDADGVSDPASFDVATEVVDASTMVVLTIEPAMGDDPAPAATHILAGPLEEGVATLSIDSEAALGTDFASAAGSYILATPTTADNSEDDTQGIWWLVPGDTPAASVDLPELPDGWVYEGWVVVDETPISTGRFTDAAAADEDGAGPTAGADGAPPFPGQDLIDPPVDLVGGIAVISVEPEPDDAPAPFVIKPLVDMDIEDIAPPDGQTMTNNAVDLPSGTATFN